MSRILVVEDEAHIAKGLRFNLEAEGHVVEIVENGEDALALLMPGNAPARKDHSQKPGKNQGQRENLVQSQQQVQQTGPGPSQQTPDNFDAMVLDVMLPGKDGFEVATELRAAQNFIPILMLTARGRPEDVLQGFEAGADDYLPKPFNLDILIARVGSLLRRKNWVSQNVTQTEDGPPDVFEFRGKSVDFQRLQLRSAGQVVQLTLMESELLRYLVRHNGRPVSRKEILEQVWGLHEDTDTRAIDRFIVRLRRYIEDQPAKPKHLLTLRGVGYTFVAEP